MALINPLICPSSNTISKTIKFRTADFIANKEPDTIYQVLDYVLNKYNQAGFSVTVYLLTMSFGLL